MEVCVCGWVQVHLQVQMLAAGGGGYEGKDTEGREGATWKEISGALLLKIAIAELSLSQD